MGPYYRIIAGKMNNRHFEDRGADYAQYRPTYPKVLAKALASRTQQTNLAIDVGCGNGQFSILLADHFETVLASDVSADQISNATPHPSILYKVGPAEKVDAADQSADLVVAAQAAHWFDLPEFYKDAKRVLKPNGIIALITYGVLEVAGPAGQRIDDFYWKEIHPFWPKGRENVENGYKDFPFPFNPIEMPSLAIDLTWSVDHFANYCNTWSAGKRAKADGRDDIIETMRKDVAGIIGADGELSIRWPITIRAGTND